MRFNPRDVPDVLWWDASTYRPGKPWKAKRSYPAWVRWIRRVTRRSDA